MKCRRRPPLERLTVLTAALALTGCGGGADDATAAPQPAADAIEYRHAIVLGVQAEQSLVYRPAAGARAATVTVSNGSALLPAGTTPLVAEHVEPALAGLRVVCVSGRGDSTNVVEGVNLGVIAESAAVLLDARWNAIAAADAWACVVAQRTVLWGWENCGVKPEGLPSPSSRRVPTAEGGFNEDVYDGNPATTFNVISRTVSSGEVAELLSSAGKLSTDDPLRPLLISWRAWRYDSGAVVFIEIGTPTASAAASTQGFIALYVPMR